MSAALFAPKSAGAASKRFDLTVMDKRIDIGLGMSYDAWTYDGTVPGPMIRVRQGDQVTIHLVNPTAMQHGLDTSAAEIAPRHFLPSPGDKDLTYSFRANISGAFLYHCSAPPMLVHVANGMYGMMIVDPARGWPPAREVMIVQGEYYGAPDGKGLVAGDSRKETAERPDFVVFDGALNRYVDHPIAIKVGQPVRVFFVNAGPNLTSTFEVSGVIFSTVYPGGNPVNVLHGIPSFQVGPGEGAVFEFRVREPGDYSFMDAALARPLEGAAGIFRAVRH
ncbi:MAG TPA: multicopper oxidase domain-containing protein [Candidatus Binataceae bacterium]|nr:multicopper oxidase domain-containing protein [Candidatus Binataceae bacterium]